MRDYPAPSVPNSTTTPDHTAGIIDTLQSLIVAFTLAMTFRGFVVEGFVIPTGSMAPTLMGQHIKLASGQTGSMVPVGLDSGGRIVPSMLRDHLLGPGQPMTVATKSSFTPRGGDRILVAKLLYPFVEPDRWDVIVFKNPAMPEGDSGTYIKRLAALPGETPWVVDGDLFIKAPGENEFHVARKPDHVQQAVWQLVHDSDTTVALPSKLPRRAIQGPWVATPPSNWTMTAGAFETTSDSLAHLEWNDRRFPLSDWSAYNMLMTVPDLNPVSDLRVAATIEAFGDGLDAAFTLKARSHVYEVRVKGGVVTVSMWPESDPSSAVSTQNDVPVSMSKPWRLVVEHADQRLRVWIEDQEVGVIEYDWTPQQRLANAVGQHGSQESAKDLLKRSVQNPSLVWSMSGAPASITNITVQRDLFYRGGTLGPQSLTNKPGEAYYDRVYPNAPAAATHPDSVFTLGPDHFFVMGDNSGRSLDARLWGAPAPITATQVDDTPFVVPRDLLIGKAFGVYLPSMLPAWDGGPTLIPDFGRIRFIH